MFGRIVLLTPTLQGLSFTKYMSNEPTIGEERVRTSFNVGDNSEVDAIKKATAEIINRVQTSAHKDHRLAALALTAYEEAAMWAVKLVTTPERAQSSGSVGEAKQSL